MDNNNTFKTILWIIVGLAIVILAVVFFTKHKNKNAEENMVIGEAAVDEIEIAKMESFPVQVSVLIKGHTSDGCTTVGDVKQNYAAGTFNLKVESKRPLDAESCTQAIQDFQKTVSLSGVVGLPKGTYSVVVNGVKGAFTLEMDNFITETDPLK